MRIVCLSVSHVRQTSDDLNAAQQLSATILQLQQQLYLALTPPPLPPTLWPLFLPLWATVIHRISISIDNTRLACLTHLHCIYIAQRIVV